MVLKTLDTLGPLHGYGIARRIEQTSGDLLEVRHGTLYPALIKLEQEGFISAEWGISDSNRRVGLDTGRGAKPDTEIVGLVEDSLYEGPRQGVRRQVFFPFPQMNQSVGAVFYVHTSAYSTGTGL